MPAQGIADLQISADFAENCGAEEIRYMKADSAKKDSLL